MIYTQTLSETYLHSVLRSGLRARTLNLCWLVAVVFCLPPLAGGYAMFVVCL